MRVLYLFTYKGRCMMNKSKSKFFLYSMLVYFVLIKILSKMHASLLPALVKSIAPDSENLNMINSYLTMSLSMGSLLLSPVWGKMIDKYGVKTMIVSSSLVFAAV